MTGAEIDRAIAREMRRADRNLAEHVRLGGARGGR
jgi:hypothetical protein